MSESDPLPKFVCWTCWNKIENFHNFHEYVHEAQANFLNDLIKYEEENHFIDVSEPVHLDTTVTNVEPVDNFNTSNEPNNDLIKTEYDASYTEDSPTMFLDEASEQISNIGDEAVELGDDKPEINSDETHEKCFESQIVFFSPKIFDYFI